MTYQHLEAVCARYGGNIEAQAPDQNIIRNALGVLREDGVFAFYLFLQYRKGQGGGVIWNGILQLWQDDAVGPLLPKDIKDAKRERQEVIALTNDLQALLLAREVAERTLVYALYGLRAKG